jgi:hypothetical protein
VELKLDGTYQLLAYADDVNLLGDNIDTIRQHIHANKEVGLEVNTGQKSVCCCIITRMQVRVVT